MWHVRSGGWWMVVLWMGMCDRKYIGWNVKDGGGGVIVIPIPGNPKQICVSSQTLCFIILGIFTQNYG